MMTAVLFIETETPTYGFLEIVKTSSIQGGHKT